MVPVWMISSYFFKVTMIRRQITWKWYNIQLSLQWPTNKKSYDLSNGAIFNDLERPLTPSVKVMPFFDAEYLRNGTTYWHRFNEILIGTYTRPTQQCHFEWLRVTLSHLAKYSMTRSASGLSATAEFLVLNCTRNRLVWGFSRPITPSLTHWCCQQKWRHTTNCNHKVRKI